MYFFRRRKIRRRIRKAVNRSDYLARKEKARLLVENRIQYFAAKYANIDPIFERAMKYSRISIRNQRGRWGSCSSKKNLNFNYRILDLNEELQDYVIVHELCHLVELNHGENFWNLMEKIIPKAKSFHSIVRKKKN